MKASATQQKEVASVDTVEVFWLRGTKIYQVMIDDDWKTIGQGEVLRMMRADGLSGKRLKNVPYSEIDEALLRIWRSKGINGVVDIPDGRNG